MDERHDPPLNDAETADLLRYWLGSMRYQEALATRPKAQRPEPSSGAEPELVPNLVHPTPGRKYIKLDWAGREAFVASRRGRVELPLELEAKGLFEDWLVSAYRRGDDDDAQRVGYLLSFPALLSPKGELASLLRTPLTLRWRAAGGAEFVVPSAAERAKSKLPEPPVVLELAHAE
ncbi:MAG TPA: hypothetical protein VNN80_22720, partial [Polyangiaceae bacterium]|nr:hypothetical protein [Polyangiaceae bacterium]